MDITKLIADKEEQDEGRWFVFQERTDDTNEVAFKLRYINYAPYQNELSSVSQKARARNRARDLSPVTTEVMCEALAGFILVDWRGLSNNGEPFPFTKPNAKVLLLQSLSVREFVLNEATDVNNFQKQETVAGFDVQPEPVSEGGELPADKRDLKSRAGMAA